MKEVILVVSYTKIQYLHPQKESQVPIAGNKGGDKKKKKFEPTNVGSQC